MPNKDSGSRMDGKTIVRWSNVEHAMFRLTLITSNVTAITLVYAVLTNGVNADGTNERRWSESRRASEQMNLYCSNKNPMNS